jgi:hypothetical protein
VPALATMQLGPSGAQSFDTALVFKSVLSKKIGSGTFGNVFAAKNLAYGGTGTIAVKVSSSESGEVDSKEPYLLRTAFIQIQSRERGCTQCDVPW